MEKRIITKMVKAMNLKANAQMADMPFEDYEARVVRALDIDYEQLKAVCEEKIEGFRGSRRRIKTGVDCELAMDTTGRKWYVDAGDGAFPCGGVYVASVENQINGTIFFENFAVEGVGVYPNVTGNEGDATIDENALGTFHIALGRNDMFGGENACRFRMDFVTKGEIN